MIAVLQRVNSAQLYINEKKYSEINNGLLILIGVNKNDSIDDIEYLIHKIIKLRIFNDTNEKMNLSILDTNGDIMIVSQFTLLANMKKGHRPSFINSANPDLAEDLYNLFIQKMEKMNINIQTGKFGAMMDIHLTNNGPATFILDSKN